MVIEGLSKRQVEICNLLWMCETTQDLNELMEVLPPQDRDQAETLMQIMLMEEYETQLEKMESYPVAEKLFAKIVAKK